jgi:excisionase family DNA binding protein
MARKKPVPNPVSTAIPESRYLTLKEAAAYCHVTLWQVRTWQWERRVPYASLGNRIVFDKSDLDKYIESQKVPVAA